MTKNKKYSVPNVTGLRLRNFGVILEKGKLPDGPYSLRLKQIPSD
jgi:hypothetical protein